jgi:hypothetical protein
MTIMGSIFIFTVILNIWYGQYIGAVVVASIACVYFSYPKDEG